MTTNPYLFAVGCLRSGTTLLQRMLSGHPQLAVAYDSHFIPGPIKKEPIGVDPPLTPALVAAARGHRRFGRLELPEEAVDAAAERSSTYTEFVCAVYDAYAELHGKPLAGEKSPGYCRHLPHLHALFPWVRTIHIIRDGRDIALSVLDWGKGPARLELWGEAPVAACALWWRRDVGTGITDGRALDPDHYREIRYEQMVSDPEAVMRDVTAYLDVPYAKEMITIFEGKTRPARTAKAAWLPPTPGLRDWRTQMAPRDVELFEALAGDLLDELGYERATRDVSPSVADAARRAWTWWESNMTLPDGRLGPPPALAGRPAATPAPKSAPTDSASGPNPFVFIVGCPRSGTTLLKRMVDAHPDLAITPETHWIPRHLRKRIGVTREGLVTDELLPRLLEYRKFLNLKLDPEELHELVGDEPLPYARFVSQVFDMYGKRRGRRLVGDKTPAYVQHIALLHDLWPAAKFVHLIRDGRDVCLSMLQWSRAPRTVGRYGIWAVDRVSTVALWWERLVRLGREDMARLSPELTHEIRYESLVADPSGQSRGLCDFLGLPYDDDMLRFHEGRQKHEEGLSAKKAFLPPTPGLRNWRAQMSESDLERFEALAGELLAELGYERACPQPGEAALARAAELRAAFNDDPRTRGRRMPATASPAAGP